MDLLGPILFFVISQFSASVDGNSVTQKHLATQQISLEKRYNDTFVNGIFKDNILLNLSYLGGKITKKEDINWENINKPYSYNFTLLPGKTFAFHEDVLPQYKDTLTKTTNAHFNYDDGFKKEGNGVCHFDIGDVLLRKVFDSINNKIMTEAIAPASTSGEWI